MGQGVPGGPGPFGGGPEGPIAGMEYMAAQAQPEDLEDIWEGLEAQWDLVQGQWEILDPWATVEEEGLGLIDLGEDQWGDQEARWEARDLDSLALSDQEGRWVDLCAYQEDLEAYLEDRWEELCADLARNDCPITSEVGWMTQTNYLKELRINLLLLI